MYRTGKRQFWTSTICSVLVCLLAGSALGQIDVTTGASPAGGSNIAGQADVDVDWTQDLSVATGTPLDIGGGWSATQVANDEQFGSAPAILNVFSPGVVTDPGAVESLATSEVHVINVLDTATVQRVTGEGTTASVILAGGEDWDFDFEDDDNNDAYDAGEDVFTGYGLRVAGAVNTPVDGGTTAVEITDATGLIFVEIDNGGTITGDVIDSGGANTLIDMVSENDQAGAMTTSLVGTASTGAGNDVIILEAVSDTQDPMTASGLTTASITDNIVMGTSTIFDEFEMEAEAMTGDAATSVGGMVDITGTGDVQISLLSQGDNNATATLTGLMTLGGPDNDLGVWLNHMNAGTGVSKFHAAAGITLGNGNTVEFTGAGNASTVVFLNDAADGTGTNQALTGGTGLDDITLTNFAAGTLLMDLDLSADGGADVVELDNTTLTGTVTFGSSAGSTLTSAGNDKIIGTVVVNGPLTIDITGPGLMVDGDIDINADTSLTRSAGSGMLVMDNASGGSGAIDVTGATFTISDVSILGATVGGFTGTGTIAIQAGTLDQSSYGIAAGLTVDTATGTTVSLTSGIAAVTGTGTLNVAGNLTTSLGDGVIVQTSAGNTLTLGAAETVAAINGDGTIDADMGNNYALTLGSGTSSFSGTLSNLGNLNVTGGTHSLGTDVSLAGNLSISDGAALTIGGNLTATAAAGNYSLSDDLAVGGNISIQDDTTFTVGVADILLNVGGAIDIAATKTLTFTDIDIIESIGSGFTGSGTLSISDGVLSNADDSIAATLTVELGANGELQLASAQALAGVTGTGLLSLTAGSHVQSQVPLADGLKLNIASGASFTLDSAAETVAALTGAGTLDASNNNLTLGGGTSNFTGTLSNLANLTTGAGGTHAIQSDLTVNDLDVDGALNVTGDVAIRAGAPRTWDLAAAMGLTGNLAVNEDTTLQGSAALTVSSGGVTIAAGKTFTLADAARLASAGTGITGTGTLEVGAGTLLESNVALADGIGLNLNTGNATLAGDQAFSSLAGTGTLDVANNNLTLTTGTGDFSGGTLSNLGGLTVTGGTHTLGALAPGGTISVTGGTLNSGTLTAANPVSVTGGDYNITGNLVASDTVTVNGGTLDISGNFGTGAALAINLGSAVTVGTTTDIDHDVTMTKAAAGGSWTTTGATVIAADKTLTLSDGSVLDSTTANVVGNGVLRIAGGSFTEAANGNLGSTLGLTIDSGASVTLTAVGGDQYFRQLNGAGTLDLNSERLLLTSGTSNFTGTLSNAVNFAVTNGTHTIGATSLAGDITTSGGTLTLSGNTSFGDNAGNVALTIDAGSTVKLLGTNTITGSVSLSGTLLTGAGGIGGVAAGDLNVGNGGAIGAASSAGATFDATGVLDLGGIAAGNAFGMNATEGNTTVSNWTTPDAAGNYGVSATGTNKAILNNLSTVDSANVERIQITSGKVYLEGTINVADEDFVESLAGGTLVLNGTATGAGTLQANGGTLLYGPNYDLATVNNITASTGVDAGGSNVTLTAATVTIDGGGVFDGGGEIDVPNTTDFNASTPTLNVGSATTVKITNPTNLGGTLTKSGNGTLELSGDAGQPVSVSGGSVRLASGGGASAVTAGAGTTVELKSGSTVTGDVTATGSTVKLQSDVIGGKLAVDDAVIEPENDVTLDSNVEIAAGKAMTVSKKTLKVTGTTSVPGGGTATVKTAAGAKVEFAGDVTGVTGNTLTLGDGSAGGTVAINGTNGVDGDVTVDGAKLMGIGPIAGALLVSSGTHSPGNSIGTQTVSSGNYTLSAGAILEIEINADAAQKADLIDVTAGSANLASSRKIQVIQADGTINTGDTFTIIQTTAGVNDSGVLVESLVTTQFAGSISGNDYILTATTRPFVDLAVGSNQLSLADALDAMGSNALTDAFGALPESQYSSGMRQLDAAPFIAAIGSGVQTVSQANNHLAGHLASLRSGDPTVAYAQTGMVGMNFAHAAQDPTALADSIDAASRTDASRLAAEVEDQGADSLLGWRPFVKAYGTFAEQDTTDDQIGYNADTAGFVAGVDRKFGEMTTLGLLIGYSYTDVDYDSNRGDADVHSLRVGPYASFDLGDFFLDASLTMGYHFNEVDRKISVGSFNRTAGSDYDSWDLSLYAGLGYDFQVAGFTITPTISMQWVHYEQESFTESGAGPANLDVDSWDTDSLQHMLAVKVSRIYRTDEMSIVPEIYLGWGHEYLEDDKIQSKFVGQTTPFAFESDSDDEDSLLFGAGVSFLLENHTSLFVRWDGSCSSEDVSHTVSAGLRWDF